MLSFITEPNQPNIQDENKFNNIIKPYRNDVGMGQLGQQLMIATRKVWRTWYNVGTKN
jgi:hypothetical protein